MHTHSIERWQHSHVFLGQRHDRHEFRTWCVVALTFAMMLAEIVGGTIFGSMAVVADGWHMATHAGSASLLLPTASRDGTRAIHAFRSAPASSANWPDLPAR
jgi:Co/Zn/Cd efflux system component